MASTLYSDFRRDTTTSNCSTPTAPTMRSLFWSGRKTCTAPSSESCTKPFSSCFCLSGSRRRIRRNSSGAKFGIPVNFSVSPWVKVSPIWIVPWLCRPIISPANASSARARSPAIKVTASEILTCLPRRTWFIFMPCL
ncbi:Uncharacterised protein [Vibrio cholerae]|nr:Uncharacterised protein [Vibrio cholerae]